MGKVRQRTEEKELLEQQLEENLGNIKHTLIIISGKGGVCKSTVASNIAFALSQDESKKIGLLDADIDGPNIPKMLGLENGNITGYGEDKRFEPVSLRPNLGIISMAFFLPDRYSPVIWRGPLKAGAIKQFLGQVRWGKLDYLVVDLPPGTGDAPLSVAQLIKNISGAIVVTTPQDVALLDSRKAINFARKLDVPVVGILENMSGLICPKCGEKIDLFKTGGGKEAAAEMGVPFLGRIPIDPEIVKSGDSGKPFVETFPESVATKAFMEVVRKVVSE
ncbi:P-loop NTPase [Candidatus Poribacteria bacterium]|nr:P-loop NTPase [Candidatus Poribacteria bacterium]